MNLILKESKEYNSSFDFYDIGTLRSLLIEAQSVSTFFLYKIGSERRLSSFQCKRGSAFNTNQAAHSQKLGVKSGPFSWFFQSLAGVFPRHLVTHFLDLMSLLDLQEYIGTLTIPNWGQIFYFGRTCEFVKWYAEWILIERTSLSFKLYSRWSIKSRSIFELVRWKGSSFQVNRKRTPIQTSSSSSKIGS